MPNETEVLMAVKLSMFVFWIVTPCGIAGRFHPFGGTQRLHLQSWYLLTSPRSITTQKTNIDNV